MEDKPESKPPFWSSLPGMITAFGGVIVAVSGLITALYTTGVIGSKASTNTAPPANTSVALASAPSLIEENDRSKKLAGKWEIIEEPSLNFDKVENVTWQYDAAISGNVLTLTGKISAIDDDKNLSSDEEGYRATYVTTLVGLTGVGEYKVKTKNGVATSYPATIRFDDDLTKFEGSFDYEKGQRITLSGKKQ